MDRGAWRATNHGVQKSQTQLSDYNNYQPPSLLVETAESFKTGVNDQEENICIYFVLLFYLFL